MWKKWERKLEKIAIPHLMNYLIGGYVIGYLLYFGTKFTNTDFIDFMTLEPYYIIHNFQIWRIFTWIMIPTNVSFVNLIFDIIMLVLYWQLGTVLERTWGTVRFNLYMFGGMLFTVIGAFALYFGYGLYFGAPVRGLGQFFSCYYIYMSIFLAFAACFPDMQVMLYFLIPIKMKWMAIIYIGFAGYDFLVGDNVTRVAIGCSLLNFLIFYLSSRNWNQINPKEVHRKRSFYREAEAGRQQRWQNQGTSGKADTSADGKKQSRHKCAICGRTEITNPELEFRFCSKCNGNYEYCQDHLFTHQHIK